MRAAAGPPILALAWLLGRAGPAPAVEYVREWVAVPALRWEELLPYVKANIVLSFSLREWDVFVCSGAVDPSGIEGFDDCRSDLAKVLLLEAMRVDPGIEAAIDREVASLRRSRPRSPAGAADRAALRDELWRRLLAAPDFVPRLRRTFERARAARRVRCGYCELDPDYRPCGLEPRGSPPGR